jgi:cytochrome c-type biogenesis protein CcmH/NrfF
MNSGVWGWRVLSFWGLPRIMVVILSLHLPSLLLAQVFPPEVKKASEAFVCQCNCNHQLSACGMVNCGSATPLRQEIAGHLKEGKTQQQIVDAFVAKYGKVILSAPTTQGLDLAAWMIPFVVLLLGLILVYVLIKAWVQRRPVLAQAGGKAVSIPESYRERMERELKDFEP